MGIGRAIGGVAQAGGQVAGALIQADAARDATRAQERTANRALDIQQSVFDTTRGDFEPFREFGSEAINPLGDLLGFNGADAAQARLEATPGFQFAFDEGIRAVDAGAANSGLINSGARARALTRFGQGLASQTLSQERNALFAALNQGQSAAAQQGAAGNAFAVGASNTLSGLGAAQAAGAQQRGSAFAGLATGLSNTFADVFS